IKNRHPQVRADYSNMDHWNELPKLANDVADDHLFVIVTARKGTVSYKNALEYLPDEIQRYFNGKNLVIIFPDQYGDQEVMTYSQSQHTEERSAWESLARWIDKRRKMLSKNK
ncbi:MAG: cation:proton antiporter, partial [Segatella salivae]